MTSYFVAQLSTMPGVLNRQEGIFYTVPEAVDEADACKQVAQEIVAMGQACPPFLFAVNSAGAKAIALQPNVDVVPNVIPAPVAPTVTLAAGVEAPTTSVVVSWSPVPNAVEYVVARSNSEAGPYTPIWSGDVTQFLDDNVTTGQQTFYVVTAGNLNGQNSSVPVSITLS